MSEPLTPDATFLQSATEFYIEAEKLKRQIKRALAAHDRSHTIARKIIESNLPTDPAHAMLKAFGMGVVEFKGEQLEAAWRSTMAHITMRDVLETLDEHSLACVKTMDRARNADSVYALAKKMQEESGADWERALREEVEESLKGA